MQLDQENEIIVLLIGIGVLFFIILNWKHLEPLATRRILVLSFCVSILGWILTILEGFFLEDILNFFEHVCYAISAILLAIWFWKEFPHRRSEAQ